MPRRNGVIHPYGIIKTSHLVDCAITLTSKNNYVLTATGVHFADLNGKVYSSIGAANTAITNRITKLINEIKYLNPFDRLPTQSPVYIADGINSRFEILVVFPDNNEITITGKHNPSENNTLFYVTIFNGSDIINMQSANLRKLIRLAVLDWLNS